jgi:hypothetical protein
MVRPRSDKTWSAMELPTLARAGRGVGPHGAGRPPPPPPPPTRAAASTLSRGAKAGVGRGAAGARGGCQAGEGKARAHAACSGRRTRSEMMKKRCDWTPSVIGSRQPATTQCASSAKARRVAGAAGGGRQAEGGSEGGGEGEGEGGGEGEGEGGGEGGGRGRGRPRGGPAAHLRRCSRRS